MGIYRTHPTTRIPVPGVLCALPDKVSVWNRSGSSSGVCFTLLRWSVLFWVFTIPKSICLCLTGSSSAIRQAISIAAKAVMSYVRQRQKILPENLRWHFLPGMENTVTNRHWKLSLEDPLRNLCGC